MLCSIHADGKFSEDHYVVTDWIKSSVVKEVTESREDELALHVVGMDKSFVVDNRCSFEVRVKSRYDWKNGCCFSTPALMSMKLVTSFSTSLLD